jgi:hypothetical protein
LRECNAHQSSDLTNAQTSWAVTPVLQRARSIRSRGKARTFGRIRTCGFLRKYELNVPLTAVIGATTFLKCYRLFESTV